MNRLIVPPLPAASRPSNTMTMRRPLVLDPVLQPQQLDLEQALVGFVLRPGHALVVGVALLPGVDQAPVLPAQDRLVLVVGLIELEVVQMEGKVDVEVHRRGRSRGTAHRSWGPGTPSG